MGHMMNRRNFLKTGMAIIGATLLPPWMPKAAKAEAPVLVDTTSGATQMHMGPWREIEIYLDGILLQEGKDYTMVGDNVTLDIPPGDQATIHVYNEAAGKMTLDVL